MPSIFSRLLKQTPERPQRQTSAETSMLPSTQFAFSLFETLKPGDRNLAISPYSARVVLSMLCEGSTGETRKSIMDTLRLDEHPDYVTNHLSGWGVPWAFNWKPRPSAAGWSWSPPTLVVR